MNVRYRNQFKRDYERMMRRGRDMALIDVAIQTLSVPLPLAESCRDHHLRGHYAGYRECHIAPDWLLIYGYERVDGERQLLLVRTGAHADLF